jgi:hypothetical protein
MEMIMGYRSDVGLCLTENGKKILEARLSELEPDADKTTYVHELLDSRRKREDQESGAVAWLWEHLKWYWDFEDVSFFESLMNDLGHDDYYFIRVGEDDDDTDVRGGFWENPFGMSLLRGITFDA